MPNEPFMIFLAMCVFLSMFVFPDHVHMATGAFLITFVINIAYGGERRPYDIWNNTERDYSPVRTRRRIINSG